MKLTKLELSGFKSFADSVTLNFGDGVTAIVGPNGCGKSNVSDAVRWVLGEQSARLLRGGKMEDVIFQGAASRRPVNVTEVSLYLDNSDGQLPTDFAEVVITRRLSRSGQSDYLLNRAPVRLRDIQDLLRGTGLGSDAGVVIEAKLIDLLLSDRADERRSLFEEAAGVGLYRDRRHTTARRLEETGTDLQRLDDLMAEVQSQLRSLARQKGKAERHQSLSEEKFAVTMALARAQLDLLASNAVEFERRRGELNEQLPEARLNLQAMEAEREEAASSRSTVQQVRESVITELNDVRLQVGRLEGDLAVAAERRTNAGERRRRAEVERGEFEARLRQAATDREAAITEIATAESEHTQIQQELGGRTEEEKLSRDRVVAERDSVRNFEQELQRHAERQRQLEGERAALDGELATLQERITEEEAHLAQLERDRSSVAERLHEAMTATTETGDAARHAVAAAEQARLLLRETRDREMRESAERRALEAELATLSARRAALEALERDRVGIAPAAAALLGRRDEYGDGILGTIADFVATDRDNAELIEQLLGEFVHAVVVRDQDTVAKIRSWHGTEQPGTLILLPLDPGPGTGGGTVDQRLVVRDSRISPWIAALVGGSEVEQSGRSVRRASGAIWLAGPASSSGPLRRRAELAELAERIDAATVAFEQADQRRNATAAEIVSLEAAASETEIQAQNAREAERVAIASREDLSRRLTNLDRERQEGSQQLSRRQERLAQAGARRDAVVTELSGGASDRDRLDESLQAARQRLAETESAQELAREARSEWQVREAHVAARLRTARETVDRADRIIAEVTAADTARATEIAGIAEDLTRLEEQLNAWQGGHDEHASRLVALETAAAEATATLQAAIDRLAAAERLLNEARHAVESMSEEHHRLEIAATEGAAERRRIVERVETEYRRPFDDLAEAAPPVEADLETLTGEAERISSALEAIGIINPLAMEEHAEESKRLAFLQSQRDDLVAARQTLLQAIREIDGTAKALFTETFNAIRSNFLDVFQTLFGGGECDLRLSTPDDPLEAEIEIHAAPRGKRTQRIHLLSSGERTLVAASLLFSIYLTKPSPFCLMDEVDAPLDDANVGRFLRLLHEFKSRTQFLVITHNPRTMHDADSIYGVTMQEPGVSTIVGVRLGEHAAV